MWHAFNLISEGDNVRSTTIRKVQNESATGSSSSNRIRTTLTISVENIDFDTQACVLRLKGRNVEENQFVKVSRLACLLTANQLWLMLTIYFFLSSDGCLSYA